MIRHDVLIVGAGPAGAATAALLARRGIDVGVFDRSRFPRPKPCAEYLSPGACRALERLGVTDHLRHAEPSRLTGMRLVSPDGSACIGRFWSAPQGSGFGLGLPREILDAEILSAAREAGTTVYEGTAVEAYGADAHRVQVRVRAGGTREAVTARLVIGADGLRSRIARQMGVARCGGRRRVALVTHAAGVSDMSDVGEMHVARGAYAGLAPIGRDVTNVAVVLDLGAGHLSGHREVLFARAIDRFPEVRERLQGATRLAPVTAVGPFAHWTTRATGNRVLLVGDAADFYDPFTGEGIYAALRGAELAASRVARALATDETDRRHLAGYDRDRLRAFGSKWLLERIIGLAVARPALFNYVVRRLAQRPHLADLLVGATGDAIPRREVLSPSFVGSLVR